MLLVAGFLLQLIVLSGLQQSASQKRAFDELREQLARSTAPIGPLDADGAEIDPGSPVALLEIPAIELAQVIVEGTSPRELFVGPGHQRHTPLPGQVGVSAILGRRAAYGGPFARLDELSPGDVMTISTGQGVFEYQVRAVRAEGDELPPTPAAGSSRLVLVTADGPAYVPSGILRVDADLVGAAVGGPARIRTVSDLEPGELAMGVDTSSLWIWVLWLQALLIVVLLAVWSLHLVGPAKTWAIFLPLLLLVGMAASAEATRLLPNLL